MLKKLEFQILSAIAELRDNAYGVSLRNELDSQYSTKVSYGRLYVTLQKMERRGYLKSERADPIAIRGHRQKKYFQLTAVGRRTYNSQIISNNTSSQTTKGFAFV